MFSTRWIKVYRDLRSNIGRTIIVICSIAVGVFAVGTVSATYVLLSRDLPGAWNSISPPTVSLFTDRFPEEVIESVRSIRGVQEAEGRRKFVARLQRGPEDWVNIELAALADYRDIRIRKLTFERGEWNPPDQELLIERASLKWIGREMGDTLVVQTPDGKNHNMKIAGVVHDVGKPSPLFDGTVQTYINLETLEWLGESREFDQIDIIVKGDPNEKSEVRRIANKVRDRVEIAGVNVWFVWIPEVGKHPADNIIKPLLLVLAVLAVLTLFLSSFLVINIISALLSQQLRQIGLMKAIGARNAQIFFMYLTLSSVFGFFALILALPVGAIGGRLLAMYMAGLMNIDITDLRILPGVLMQEIAIGIVLPLGAALVPVISATRVTVREAITSVGIGRGSASGKIDRFVQKVHWLSRPLLLSLRNTFRLKGRFALTLITLVSAGAVFIAVFSVHESLGVTLQQVFNYWNYDIGVQTQRPYLTDFVRSATLHVPGVIQCEGWGVLGVRRLRPDKTEGESVFLTAIQPGSKMIKPILLEGRWLLPQDETAIVVNTDFLKTEKDVKVGDFVTFKFKERETGWRVVGLVSSAMSGAFAYTNYPYFSKMAREVGSSRFLVVVTERHDAAYQKRIAREIEKYYRNVGIKIYGTVTIGELKERVAFQFNIMVVLLLSMAVLLAIVGALGLTGTMTINVIERTREIGVMRAIGASDSTLLRLFLAEGILIGLLSWSLAVLISYPLGLALSNAIGRAFMQTPLTYRYSLLGVLIWFASVIVLSAFASWIPSRKASKLSVREVLAYE